MKQMRRGACVGACVMWVAALSGCSSMRPAEHPAAPQSPPVVTPDNPPTPPSAESTAPPETGSEPPPPSSSDTATAPCVPPETKPKPKSKPKPRPVHKEAPPQPQTAPVVAATPRGGLVDTEVRAMPVSVMSILGKKVEGPKGEDLGRVVDVLADASGRVRIAIIDFGGFLGVGDHRIAVDWPLLRFNPNEQEPTLQLDVSREKLRTAPEYKANPRPQILMVRPAAGPASTTAAAAPPEGKK